MCFLTFGRVIAHKKLTSEIGLKAQQITSPSLKGWVGDLRKCCRAKGPAVYDYGTIDFIAIGN